MKFLFKFAGTLMTAVALTACGGGDGGGEGAAPTVAVAGANLTVPASGVVVASVADTAFTFDNGIPDLGATGPTTLTFGGTAAAPTFKVESSSGTITGNVGFGSCIFKYSIVVGGVATPKEVRVNPCDINLDTSGKPADGKTQSVGARLRLGTLNSRVTPVTITIAPSGVISVVDKQGNVVQVGSVEIKTVTGTGSSSTNTP